MRVSDKHVVQTGLKPTFKPALEVLEFQLSRLAGTQTLTEQCRNHEVEFLGAARGHAFITYAFGNEQRSDPCPKVLILLLGQLFKLLA